LWFQTGKAPSLPELDQQLTGFHLSGDYTNLTRNRVNNSFLWGVLNQSMDGMPLMLQLLNSGCTSDEVLLRSFHFLMANSVKVADLQDDTYRSKAMQWFVGMKPRQIQTSVMVKIFDELRHAGCDLSDKEPSNDPVIAPDSFGRNIIQQAVNSGHIGLVNHILGLHIEPLMTMARRSDEYGFNILEIFLHVFHCGVFQRHHQLREKKTSKAGGATVSAAAAVSSTSSDASASAIGLSMESKDVTTPPIISAKDIGEAMGLCPIPFEFHTEVLNRLLTDPTVRKFWHSKYITTSSRPVGDTLRIHPSVSTLLQCKGCMKVLAKHGIGLDVPDNNFKVHIDSSGSWLREFEETREDEQRRLDKVREIEVSEDEDEYEDDSSEEDEGQYSDITRTSVVACMGC
jgi:hypothetical protein